MKQLLKTIAGSILSLEKRAKKFVGGSIQNPPSWLEKMLIGSTDEENVSGVEITEANALTIAAVYACVRNIVEDFAKLPVVVTRRSGGKRERVENHPISKLLGQSPNPEMTAFDFRSALQAHVLLGGNCMSEIVRLGNGRPAELWPMIPERTSVLRNSRTGEIFYRYSDPKTFETVDLPASDVLHVKGLGYDGLLGYSVVGWARQSMGLTAAAEKFGASFFGNSSLPRGVLEHPGELGTEGQKLLRDSWEKNHQGPARANRIGILEEGMKFHAITIPPEEAQFLESRQFQVLDICRWFRMPPHKIADLSRATFSNIEHAAIEYVGDTLVPWLTRWEQEIRRKLLMQSEGSLEVRFDVNALLRGDMKSRYEAYAIGRQWGWFSPNDVRDSEDLSPIPEGGDIYLVPVNMQDAATVEDAPVVDPNVKDLPSAAPAKKPGDKLLPEPAPDPALADAAVREIFSKSFRRLASSIAEKLARNAKREDRSAWLSTFVGTMPEAIEAEIRPVVRAAVAMESYRANKGIPLGIVDTLADGLCRPIVEAAANRTREFVTGNWWEDGKLDRYSDRVEADVTYSVDYIRSVVSHWKGSQ